MANVPLDKLCIMHYSLSKNRASICSNPPGAYYRKEGETMTSTTKALITVAATIGILAFSFLLTTLINNRGKKHTGSDATDDWNIGGRSLPLYVVIGTQFASAMGGRRFGRPGRQRL